MEQKILIFKLLIFFYLIFFSFNSLSKETIIGKAKIIDGDTIHIGKNKIRLHGIEAPEINQKCEIKKKKWNCGIKSKKALENFVLKKEVYCEIIDIDQYKRFIGICFVNNKSMNQHMVKSGWAIAYRYYSFDYVKDEEIAKNNKIGIWQGSFIEPYLYRRYSK